MAPWWVLITAQFDPNLGVFPKFLVKLEFKRLVICW